MRSFLRCLGLFTVCTVCLNTPSLAATRYVWAGSPVDGPGTDWNNAFHTIQAAVDAASVGDTVLVTNGVYATGGRVTPWHILTNRVVITNNIVLQSVNGPVVTIIQGHGPAGESAVRCVFMSAGSLSGFTLTGGFTHTNADYYYDESGGGVYASYGCTLTNCVLTGNSAYYNGGGIYQGTVNNCVLSNNTAIMGGGAYGCALNACTVNDNTTVFRGWTWARGGGACECTLNGCTISGNSAMEGGGVSGSTLSNCVITANSSTGGHGGGALVSTLYNCTLSENSTVWYGGGAFGGTVKNCILIGNSARGYGGGVYESLVENSFFSGNTADLSGGGASGGALTNCTLVGNTAATCGGGADGSTLKNCIVYYNTASRSNNVNAVKASYSCTTPDPGGGGNITNDPMLVSMGHITPNSPCVGMGSAADAKGVDIDNEPWKNPPAIGCDEVWANALTGSLIVALQPMAMTAATHAAIAFSAQINGLCTSNRWSFDDGSTLTNSLYAHRAWAVPGDYAIVLRAYNLTYPQGIAATATIHVVSPEGAAKYVWPSSPTPAYPYNDWAHAAHTIQEAVDAQTLYGGWVWVTNGVYATGARATPGYGLTNRLVITNNIVVKSVNGPNVTIIQGRGPLGSNALRCVFMTKGVLEGFTLTNGFTNLEGYENFEKNGGGAYAVGAVLSNCVISGNGACANGGGVFGGTLYNCTVSVNRVSGSYTYSVSGKGGGACYSILHHCTIVWNYAIASGGGVSEGELNNCTITGNSAIEYGGGVFGSILNNCVVSDNSANQYGGGASGSTLKNCTLTGNSTYGHGGGTHLCVVTNSVVYYNSGPDGANYYGGVFGYSCTTPDPGGVSNITTEPLLASFSHLATNSPCIEHANYSACSGVDIDGEAWINPPCMGCDQVVVPAVTGALSVAIVSPGTNVAVGFAVGFKANIRGKAYRSAWSFGDGATATNRPITAHAWGAVGNYPVVLTAWNGSNPGGVSATVMMHVVTQPIHYVRVNSTTPTAPYTTWSTAATTIQNAVNVCTVLGGKVLVSNGVYSVGGMVTPGGLLTNRVVVTNAVIVQAVTNVSVTIMGRGSSDSDAIRCVYLANGAVLSGFTLSGGCPLTVGEPQDEYAGAVYAPGGSLNNCAINENAGGVSYGVLNNCSFYGNSNYAAAFYCSLKDCTLLGNKRGGAQGGLLDHCTLTANSQDVDGGGGANGSTLTNCTLSSNSTDREGGGVKNSTAYNCTFMSNTADGIGGGANLSTLYNCTFGGNYAWIGGAVGGCTLNNCTLSGNAASTGGGASGSIMNHCVISNNSAFYDGGGVWFGCELSDCTLVGNSAYEDGGGSHDSTLVNCVLAGNSASKNGGGAWGGRLVNCRLTGNSAVLNGGGTSGSSLTNCIISGNVSSGNGGGASGGTLNNCSVSGNSATYYGGGTAGGTLINCTLSGNSACGYGGGTYMSGVTNCIVYHNTAPCGANFMVGTYGYSCTTPDPGGISNITADPLLVGASHIATNSPCIGRGIYAVCSGVDIDGESWLNPPSMGCDQVINGAVTGALSVAVVTPCTNVVVGFAANFSANIQGKGYRSAWSFGDGVTATNQPAATHAWTSVGNYPVVLTAWNGTSPGGISATVTMHVVTQPIHYVKVNNATPVSPYTSWSTAATTIQNAIDACSVLGGKVLVTNGVYTMGGALTPGGTLTNRIVVTNAIIVQSVNGPANTFISGRRVSDDDAMRCAYVGNGAVLSGFTLTNGCTFGFGMSQDLSGGAVFAPGGVLTNCILKNNYVNSLVGHGGGTEFGTLYNCTLISNSAPFGGGAYLSVLNHCTLSGNYADNNGGGADGGSLSNCTLNGNGSGGNGGGTAYCVFMHHCTFNGNLAAGDGGGAYYGVLSNCTFNGNWAGSDGGGAYSYECRMDNCAFNGNSAGVYGGGACYGIADHCTFNGNVATNSGGGTAWVALTNCTLSGNYSVSRGGGAYYGSLANCSISGNNSGNEGGGICYAPANSCTISNNTSAIVGGGANDSWLNNCLIVNNVASNGGGGACNYANSENKLINCTVCNNSTPSVGGGIYWNGIVENSIVYNNHSDWDPMYDNYASSWMGTPLTFAYSCTAPEPGGEGNITNAPGFVSAGHFHLSSNSPCVNAGNNDYVVRATDLDGNPRIQKQVVDMGAFESSSYGLMCLFESVAFNAAKGVVLNWTCANGWQYTLQESPRLMDPAWTNVPPYTNLLGAGIICITNEFTAASNRFLRVERTPVP
jgi:parallel beta-helix repeat protein